MNKESGVGLIEILITLLLLSIGVLGISSMQRFALSENMDTAQRSQVVWLGQEVAEKIRANSTLEAVNEFTSLMADYAGDPTQCGTLANNCSTSQCTYKETAAYDAYQLACDANSSKTSQSLDNIILKSFTVRCGNTADTVCDEGESINITIGWQSIVKSTDDTEKTKATKTLPLTIVL